MYRLYPTIHVFKTLKMAEKKERGKIQLQEKIKEILVNHSKINDIVDIVEELDNKDTAVVLQCIEGLGEIFSKLIKSGTCPIRKVRSSMKTSNVPENLEEVLQRWLNQNYSLTVSKLLSMLHSPEVAEKILATLMMFIQAESHVLQEKSQTYKFSNDLYLKTVERLTDGLNSNDIFVKLMSPYLQYGDVCYYLLRNVSKIISKFSNTSECGTHFARNIYRLLVLAAIPHCEDDLGHLFAYPTDDCKADDLVRNHGIMKLSCYKKVFTDAWTSFLGFSLDSSLYRQVLLILEEKVIPYLVDPKVLMDFLVDSYNIGGVTSILALNSLFVLIHQYNLDYPDFYKKLYSLFDMEIFHLKYRGRFFYLADLFLTSTHLPAYLVAAFIKRLSRIALRAPPYGVAVTMAFVGNLIRRHPNCKVLIHKKQESTDDEELHQPERFTDPFKENEPDPSQCQALQSSLWELESLRHHYYPHIKSLFELLEKPISKNETDVSEFFECSYETVFEKECVELRKNNAFIEYHVPKGLMSDSMKELWCID